MSDTEHIAKRYALFGHPVAHSRSPWIHAQFAHQEHIFLTYQAIDAEPAQFATVLAAFAAGGGEGANITLPLKALAAAHCAELTPIAKRAGVVNTLIRQTGGTWTGDNTDGIGLIHDITERHRFDLRNRRTLILGAGGAVAGIVDALIQAGVGEMVIANRTAAKADALVDRIGEPAQVHSAYWNNLKNMGAFDLVINGTSAGHSNQALELPFSLTTQRTLCYDLGYGSSAVNFLAWAKSAGCAAKVDGLGMLVEQAAESFQRWHGVRPEVDDVYQALHKEMSRV